METKLTYNQKTMLRKRGLNPDDYVVVKDTYVSLTVRNVHTGQLKIIVKQN